MKEGLEEFLRRIEEKPTNETLIDRFVSLVLEEEILDRVLYLKKLVGLLLNPNPYVALKIAALELQEARKEKLNKEYEIGALKDVESCFLKLDKLDNAQLVREEIGKLTAEHSRFPIRAQVPATDGDSSPEPVDRKAKLHFRLPQGLEGNDEPTSMGVPAEEEQERGESRPPIPEDQEARRSALQISAIGVGPNILDGQKAEEPGQRLRKVASLFESSEGAGYGAEDTGPSVPEPETQLVPSPKHKDDETSPSLSGSLYAESQQLHFPEQTQNLSLDNRYKTALAKPHEVLREVKPEAKALKPKPGAPRHEERMFGGPYGEDDTGFRETLPVFPSAESDPTEILGSPGIQPLVSSPAKPLPPTPPLDVSLKAELPASLQQAGSSERRWDIFRERLILSSGLQIDKRLLQEFLQKLTGYELNSDSYRRVMALLLDLMQTPLTPRLQRRVLEWMFEELEPKIMQQLWGTLRLQEDGPQFFRQYMLELLSEQQCRRAFHVLRDVAVPGLSLDWARVSYALLPSLWGPLGLREWFWAESEGPEAFAERMRKREELNPSAHLWLGVA